MGGSGGGILWLTLTAYPDSYGRASTRAISATGSRSKWTGRGVYEMAALAQVRLKRARCRTCGVWLVDPRRRFFNYRQMAEHLSNGHDVIIYGPLVEGR